VKTEKKSAKAEERPGKKGVTKSEAKGEEKGSVGKVVRDSFTMPVEDHGLIERVRHLCLKRMMVVSKSEVLRAGVILLNKLPEKEIIEIIKNLPKVKTGRPPIE
jgi:hypothetical protein